MTAIAWAQARVAEVELAMLETEEIEPLRPALEAARAALAQAEARAQAQERRPSAEQLWREWQDVKFLRRRNMTPRLKAWIIGRFGRANYARMPW